MVIYLDESLTNLISSGLDNETRDFFIRLANNAKYDKYLLLASRSTFTALVKSNLQDDVKKIYQSLISIDNQALLKTLDYYIVVYDVKIIEPHNSKSFKVSIQDLAAFKESNLDYVILNNSALLCENTSDLDFYYKVLLNYYKTVNINKYKTLLKYCSGGGDPTAEVFKTQVHSPTLCIIDSDKKYEGATYGETANKVLNAHKKLSKEDLKYLFSHVEVLDIHEAENLIPLTLMEEKATHLKQDERDLLKLISSDIKRWFFYDFKNGVIHKKLKTTSNYANYWKQFIHDLGLNICQNIPCEDECKCSTLLPAAGKALLKIHRDVSDSDFENQEYLKDEWLKIGKILYDFAIVDREKF